MPRIHQVSQEEQRRAELARLQAGFTGAGKAEMEQLELEREKAETLTGVGVSDVSREFEVSRTAVARRLEQLGQEIAVVVEQFFSPNFGEGGRFLTLRVTRLSAVQLEMAEVVALEVKLNGQRRNGRCRTVVEGKKVEKPVVSSGTLARRLRAEG